MQGGKKGLLDNSRNLCRSTNRATVRFDGQNGKASDLKPVLKAKCPKRHKKGHKGHGSISGGRASESACGTGDAPRRKAGPPKGEPFCTRRRSCRRCYSASP